VGVQPRLSRTAFLVQRWTRLRPGRPSSGSPSRTHSPRRGHSTASVEQHDSGQQVGRPLGTLRCSPRKIREKMSSDRRAQLGASPVGRRWRSATARSVARPVLEEAQFSEWRLRLRPRCHPPRDETTLFAYTPTRPKATPTVREHIALVEVDGGVGLVKLLKYFAVDDCAGHQPARRRRSGARGVVRASAQALLEDVGLQQRRTGSRFPLPRDYLIPTGDAPRIVGTGRRRRRTQRARVKG